MFGEAAPGTVVVTTPNVEHNVRYEALAAGARRHRDHRFEWTRAEFRAWADAVGARYGIRRPVRPGRRGRPRGRAADPAGGLHQGGDGVAEPRTELSVPALSLVVLVGVTGSGKSTFARAHFARTEVLSSDACRGLVADDENDQIGHRRTPSTRCTTSPASGSPRAGSPWSTRPTCSRATARSLVALAREHDVLPVAIVLDVPGRVCAARNAGRPDRDFGAARDPPPARPAAPRAARPAARGLPRRCTCCARRRRSRRRRVVRTRLYNDRGTRPGRSTSSATSTAAAPSSRTC